MPCYSPLKGFVSLSTGGILFKRSSDAGASMEVACGQCLGCRLDKSKEWAARIVHESSLYDENCFITLTYREPWDCTKEQRQKGYHKPLNGSLNKKHFQDFMKRLRKMFKDRRIRYYHCGEYGDKLNRPHYHACLFNLSFPDIELFQEREGNFLFTSKILEKLWPYGFSTIGDLSFESAAYCARYVTKKVTGTQSHEHYSRIDVDTGEVYQVEPEYATMSRRPGIGRVWYEKYKDDCFPSDEVPVPGAGVFPKVPRYYEQIFQREDGDGHEEIKRRRKVFRKEHAADYTPQRLMDKYKVKKAQIETLRRDKI